MGGVSFENIDGGSPKTFLMKGGGVMMGSIPEKIFLLASMKNHFLHGFVGESGPSLVHVWY